MEPEGSLLDSVSADAALVNEWSLPVLPEGVGHILTPTQLNLILYKYTVATT